MVDSKEGLASMSFKITCQNNLIGLTRSFMELKSNVQNGIKGSLNRSNTKPCHAFSHMSNQKAPCYACDDPFPHWTNIILE